MSRDPYKYFRIEARELLEQLNQGTLELERSPTPEIVSRLLRHAHTLKGAARVVRQSEIANLAHELEDVLAAPAADTAEMLGILDRMSSLLARLGESPPEMPAQAATPAPATVPLAQPVAPPPQDSELDSLTSDLREARVVAARLRQQVRELQSVQLQLAEAPLARRLGEVKTELEDNLDRLDRELDQVAGAAESLRLVPLSRLEGVLRRTLRDAAYDLGKSARLSWNSGELRVPGETLIVLQEALVQLVRNALAHGIESPQTRRQRHKDPEGHVSVSIRRSGRHLRCRITDDGAGLDKEALQSKARALGLAEETSWVDILTTHGISTAEQVTGVAGRGVGMDVVRQSVQRLQGRLSVETEEGRGTTFELDFPISLAWVEAVGIHSAGRQLYLPLSSVRQSLRLEADELLWGQEGLSIHWEQRLLPLVFLEEVLFAQTPKLGQAISVLVVESEPGPMALAVDRVGSVAGVLVRPLPALAVANPLVVGLALDGFGEPQLVLDASRLQEPARGSRSRVQRSAAARQRRILVVDDSLTSRMLQQSILESSGFAVQLASSGEEALQILQKEQFDACLVDVEMPGMTGFELLERLRADSRLDSMPAILITSLSSEEHRRRGFLAGARGYIVKSEFDQQVLMQLLAELIP